MPSDSKKLKVVVVGGGPVGALAALYAGMRGHDVEVYELRNDLRDPNTIPLNFTKSINLALSERGINAMRNSGRSDLIQKVLDQTIPMRGRMVHGRSITGELTEQPQDYDAHGRAIFAADRGALNKILLDELEALPNVKFFFLHKLINADLRSKKAWFEIHQDDASEPKWTPQTKYPLVEVAFDLLIGADGAHSAVRSHLMKYERLDYQQEYIDTLWVELIIEPNQAATQSSPDSKWVMSPHHLHIWPGKDFMFIAIAGTDGSFSCTLFAPAAHFHPLESDPSIVPKFFDTHFPGVTSLIPPESLINSFNTNPHLPLISIKMSPYHHKSAAVLLGDAAHAMVPFYGQGMNAGLEDVYTLFTAIDMHGSLGEALAAYSLLRKPDAHAINDLALQNYTEMRSSVTSRIYKIRKYLEETLSTWVPSLGWETKYARVSFGNERYSEVVRKSERQGKLLLIGLVGLMGLPVIGGAVGLWLKLQKANAGFRWVRR